MYLLVISYVGNVSLMDDIQGCVYIIYDKVKRDLEISSGL